MHSGQRSIALSALASHLPGARPLGDTSVRVGGIAYDSRRVRPGDLFVAVPGQRHDGHDFLPEAIAAGAAGVVVQADREDQWRPLLEGASLPALVVRDTRRALSRLAAAFHGFPARRLTVIGVTGTDGKTSLVHLTAHLLRSAGERTGALGTTGWSLDGQQRALAERTTPEAPEVQAALAEMATDGCRYAILECSSHGLALCRVEDCDFDVAAITNIGRDHLDFHGSWESYRAAKGRLFQLLDAGYQKDIPKVAVLNADDPSYHYFRSLTRARSLTYGLAGPADVTAHDIAPEGWGSRFCLRTPQGEAVARVGRPGLFNVANALAATAVALALGLPLRAIVEGLASWPGVPGRMELVDEGQPFLVVVDYAHAPEALQRALELLRRSVRGRVIVVFGCLGGRDRERRFPMGEVAGRLADYAIVTEDDSYDEDRESIMQEIAAGLRAVGRLEGHHFALVPDRREAIAQALAMASDDDAVLLAGRGHEETIYSNNGPYPCDDRAVAREVLRQLFPRR